ncbi:hypothetical protein BKA70DRAFT_1389589 [Coprinopsis sp. MPI-PUGE-AT-0042]|nr:hypothetical protein BKA70DRAFT_1389589 [Coprinopsis sp. MPI-PUGE-AT-0042]
MIILFDIPSTLRLGFSSNTLKTRFCLAYKGLEHRTEWVEFPDVAAVCKEKGIGATGSWKDGSPYYSLPAIIDDHKGTGVAPTAVSESFEIAKYLDATYPETKRLVFLPFARIFFPRAATILNPASKEYFSKKRAAQFFDANSLDDVQVKSAEEEGKIWDDFREGWNEGPWVLGDTISFADLVVALYLVTLQRVFGQQSKEWQELRVLNGGRWGRLFDETQYLLKVEY